MLIQIESETTKGKFYEIDTVKQTCTCPAFVNRKRFGKSFCKHYTKYMNQQESVTPSDKLIDAIRYDNDVLNFMNKFGEEKLNYLKITGQVFETRGKLVILE